MILSRDRQTLKFIYEYEITITVPFMHKKQLNKRFKHSEKKQRARIYSVRVRSP
jgi:hypothetical protein